MQSRAESRRPRRLAVDMGGTFTDLVLENPARGLEVYKALTVPENPIQGVMDVLRVAGEQLGVGHNALLRDSDLFIHGTTRATNAIVTEKTARTALLTTKGHPDILTFREGGRSDIFNYRLPYPKPYVPRALTFEVSERIDAQGDIVHALDEDQVLEIVEGLRDDDVEAVAVCLLWSIINPDHELRLGQLLDQHLPGVPYTLSHELNPIIREYRRASSTAIDASLKPLMSGYFSELGAILRDAGFGGRVLIVTSSGSVLDAEDVATAPIHSIGSGPAVAPVAGREYMRRDGAGDTAIVADAGGTTYDVSVVRGGRIPWTREAWLGERFRGHMTGFASVDVTSVGAGGGSIAWVDRGGLLHVGPDSAGASPGPACYGRGGTQPTVTDACALLGYLDPEFFLGGGMSLDVPAAQAAMREHVAAKLGLDVDAASAAVLELATERMVQAIEEITLKQGIDPRGAVLLAGGGASGLNAVAIARRLGCPSVIIPEVAAALSAAGALMSELSASFTRSAFTSTSEFDFDLVRGVVADLERQCLEFATGAGVEAYDSTVELTVECRYPHQVWEIEVPLPTTSFETTDDVEALRQAFHERHREIFAIADPDSHVEIVAWRARARCRLHDDDDSAMSPVSHDFKASREAYFGDVGWVPCTVRLFGSIASDERLAGPALIESETTTVVVPPGASASRTGSGSLVITPS